MRILILSLLAALFVALACFYIEPYVPCAGPDDPINRECSK